MYSRWSGPLTLYDVTLPLPILLAELHDNGILSKIAGRCSIGCITVEAPSLWKFWEPPRKVLLDDVLVVIEDLSTASDSSHWLEKSEAHDFLLLRLADVLNGRSALYLSDLSLRYSCRPAKCTTTVTASALTSLSDNVSLSQLALHLSGFESPIVSMAAVSFSFGASSDRPHTLSIDFVNVDAADRQLHVLEQAARCWYEANVNSRRADGLLQPCKTAKDRWLYASDQVMKQLHNAHVHSVASDDFWMLFVKTWRWKERCVYLNERLHNRLIVDDPLSKAEEAELARLLERIPSRWIRKYRLTSKYGTTASIEDEDDDHDRTRNSVCSRVMSRLRFEKDEGDVASDFDDCHTPRASSDMFALNAIFQPLLTEHSLVIISNRSLVAYASDIDRCDVCLTMTQVTMSGIRDVSVSVETKVGHVEFHPLLDTAGCPVLSRLNGLDVCPTLRGSYSAGQYDLELCNASVTYCKAFSDFALQAWAHIYGCSFKRELLVPVGGQQQQRGTGLGFCLSLENVEVSTSGVEPGPSLIIQSVALVAQLFKDSSDSFHEHAGNVKFNCMRLRPDATSSAVHFGSCELDFTARTPGYLAEHCTCKYSIALSECSMFSLGTFILFYRRLIYDSSGSAVSVVCPGLHLFVGETPLSPSLRFCSLTCSLDNEDLNLILNADSVAVDCLESLGGSMHAKEFEAFCHQAESGVYQIDVIVDEGAARLCPTLDCSADSAISLFESHVLSLFRIQCLGCEYRIDSSAFSLDFADAERKPLALVQLRDVSFNFKHSAPELNDTLTLTNAIIDVNSVTIANTSATGGVEPYIPVVFTSGSPSNVSTDTRSLRVCFERDSLVIQPQCLAINMQSKLWMDSFLNLFSSSVATFLFPVLITGQNLTVSVPLDGGSETFLDALDVSCQSLEVRHCVGHSTDFSVSGLIVGSGFQFAKVSGSFSRASSPILKVDSPLMVISSIPSKFVCPSPSLFGETWTTALRNTDVDISIAFVTAKSESMYATAYNCKFILNHSHESNNWASVSVLSTEVSVMDSVRGEPVLSCVASSEPLRVKEGVADEIPSLMPCFRVELCVNDTLTLRSALVRVGHVKGDAPSGHQSFKVCVPESHQYEAWANWVIGFTKRLSLEVVSVELRFGPVLRVADFKYSLCNSDAFHVINWSMTWSMLHLGAWVDFVEVDAGRASLSYAAETRHVAVELRDFLTVVCSPAMIASISLSTFAQDLLKLSDMPQLSRLHAELSLTESSFVIVDSFQGRKSPLLRASLPSSRVHMYPPLMYSALMDVCIDVYRPSTDSWEPALESVAIKMNKEPKPNTPNGITYQVVTSSPLEMTLTPGHVNQIRRFGGQLSSSNDSVDIDRLSVVPVTVCNLLGLDICIHFGHDDFDIPSGNTFTAHMPADFSPGVGLSKPYMIGLSFPDDATIHDFAVNVAGETVCHLSNGWMVVCDSSIRDDVHDITFHSRMKVHNMTNLPVDVLFTMSESVTSAKDLSGFFGQVNSDGHLWVPIASSRCDRIQVRQRNYQFSSPSRVGAVPADRRKSEKCEHLMSIYATMRPESGGIAESRRLVVCTTIDPKSVTCEVLIKPVFLIENLTLLPVLYRLTATFEGQSASNTILTEGSINRAASLQLFSARTSFRLQFQYPGCSWSDAVDCACDSSSLRNCPDTIAYIPIRGAVSLNQLENRNNSSSLFGMSTGDDEPPVQFTLCFRTTIEQGLSQHAALFAPIWVINRLSSAIEYKEGGGPTVVSRVEPGPNPSMVSHVSNNTANVRIPSFSANWSSPLPILSGDPLLPLVLEFGQNKKTTDLDTEDDRDSQAESEDTSRSPSSHRHCLPSVVTLIRPAPPPFDTHTKIVTLSAQYFICNRLPVTLRVRQPDSDTEFSIAPGEMFGDVLWEAGLPKVVACAAGPSGWTSPFEISFCDALDLHLPGNNSVLPVPWLHVDIQGSNANSTVFAVVSIANPNVAPAEFENATPFDVVLEHEDSATFRAVVPKRSVAAFSWSDPVSRLVRIRLDGDLTHTVDLNDESMSAVVRIGKFEGRNVYALSSVSGSANVIRLVDCDADDGPSTTLMEPRENCIGFAGRTLSHVISSFQSRIELLYVGGKPLLQSLRISRLRLVPSSNEESCQPNDTVMVLIVKSSVFEYAVRFDREDAALGTLDVLFDRQADPALALCAHRVDNGALLWKCGIPSSSTGAVGEQCSPVFDAHGSRIGQLLYSAELFANSTGIVRQFVEQVGRSLRDLVSFVEGERQRAFQEFLASRCSGILPATASDSVGLPQPQRTSVPGIFGQFELGIIAAEALSPAPISCFASVRYMEAHAAVHTFVCSPTTTPMWNIVHAFPVPDWSALNAPVQVTIQEDGNPNVLGSVEFSPSLFVEYPIFHTARQWVAIPNSNGRVLLQFRWTSKCNEISETKCTGISVQVCVDYCGVSIVDSASAVELAHVSARFLVASLDIAEQEREHSSIWFSISDVQVDTPDSVAVDSHWAKWDVPTPVLRFSAVWNYSMPPAAVQYASLAFHEVTVNLDVGWMCAVITTFDDVFLDHRHPAIIDGSQPDGSVLPMPLSSNTSLTVREFHLSPISVSVTILETGNFRGSLGSNSNHARLSRFKTNNSGSKLITVDGLILSGVSGPLDRLVHRLRRHIEMQVLSAFEDQMAVVPQWPPDQAQCVQWVPPILPPGCIISGHNAPPSFPGAVASGLRNSLLRQASSRSVSPAGISAATTRVHSMLAIPQGQMMNQLKRELGKAKQNLKAIPKTARERLSLVPASLTRRGHPGVIYNVPLKPEPQGCFASVAEESVGEFGAASKPMFYFTSVGEPCDMPVKVTGSMSPVFQMARVPRAFYNQFGSIRPYDLRDALACLALRQNVPAGQNEAFVSHVAFAGSNYVLLCSTQRIILCKLTPTRSETCWFILLRNIIVAHVTAGQLVIKANDNHGFLDASGIATFSTDNEVAFAVASIEPRGKLDGPAQASAFVEDAMRCRSIQISTYPAATQTVLPYSSSILDGVQRLEPKSPGDTAPSLPSDPHDRRDFLEHALSTRVIELGDASIVDLLRQSQLDYQRNVVDEALVVTLLGIQGLDTDSASNVPSPAESIFVELKSGNGDVRRSSVVKRSNEGSAVFEEEGGELRFPATGFGTDFKVKLYSKKHIGDVLLAEGVLEVRNLDFDVAYDRTCVATGKSSSASVHLTVQWRNQRFEDIGKAIADCERRHSLLQRQIQCLRSALSDGVSSSQVKEQECGAVMEALHDRMREIHVAMSMIERRNRAGGGPIRLQIQGARGFDDLDAAQCSISVNKIQHRFDIKRDGTLQEINELLRVDAPVRTSDRIKVKVTSGKQGAAWKTAFPLEALFADSGAGPDGSTDPSVHSAWIDIYNVDKTATIGSVFIVGNYISDRSALLEDELHSTSRDLALFESIKSAAESERGERQAQGQPGAEPAPRTAAAEEGQAVDPPADGDRDHVTAAQVEASPVPKAGTAVDVPAVPSPAPPAIAKPTTVCVAVQTVDVETDEAFRDRDRQLRLRLHMEMGHRRQRKVFDGELQSLSATLKRQAAELEGARGLARSARLKLEAAHHEIQFYRKRFDAFADSKNAEVSALQAEAAAKDEQCVRLMETLKDLERRHGQLLAQVDNEASLRSLSSRIERSVLQSDRVHSALDALQDDFDKVVVSEGTLKSRVSALRAELADATAANAGLLRLLACEQARTLKDVAAFVRTVSRKPC